jgi:DNA-binding MarR family transcriptional regulator
MTRSHQSASLSLEACKHAVATCTSFNLRKAVRVATQIFDEALRPVNLRCTQFVTLLAIRLLGATSMGQLAHTTVTDPTTMSRGVEPLRRRGLVTSAVGIDQRERLITLTPAGHKMLSDAYPHWQEAQTTVSRLLGRGPLDQLHQALNRLVDQVGQSEHKKRRTRTAKAG